MHTTLRLLFCLAVAGACLGACAAEHTATGASPGATSTSQQEKTVTTKHIRGEFDVAMSPQTDSAVSDPAIGRFGLDKTYRGPLEAGSKGQMLGFRSSVKGSAGYVAMERVVGTLEGRRGSFVLQHDGTMKGGDLHLNIVVVPDSGTDELVGLSGTMKIDIVEGKHFYVFEYTMP